MTLKNLRKFMVFSLIFLLFFSMALAKSSPKFTPSIDQKYQAPITTPGDRAWWIDISYFGNYLWTYLNIGFCLLYTSPSPRDRTRSRMPSSA